MPWCMTQFRLLTRDHYMEQKLYWLSQVVGRALTDLDSLHVRECPTNNPILNLTSTFRCWHWLTLPFLHQELDLEPLSCEGGEPWRDGSLLLTFLREVWCVILMLVVTMAMMVASSSSSTTCIVTSRSSTKAWLGRSSWRTGWERSFNLMWWTRYVWLPMSSSGRGTNPYRLL